MATGMECIVCITYSASRHLPSIFVICATPQHVSFAPPPSIFSPNLEPRLLSPLVVFGILAPLFGTPSLLILELSTPTPPSNPISKLFCSVLQAFLAPNNTIHALLIHIYMLILAPKLFYILPPWPICVHLPLTPQLSPYAT